MILFGAIKGKLTKENLKIAQSCLNDFPKDCIKNKISKQEIEEYRKMISSLIRSLKNCYDELGELI